MKNDDLRTLLCDFLEFTGLFPGERLAPTYKAPLAKGLSGVFISTARYNVLKDHATPSMKSVFNMAAGTDGTPDQKTLKEGLVHGFHDPLAKLASSYILLLADGYDPELLKKDATDLPDKYKASLYNTLVRSGLIIEDMTENFRLILSDADPADALEIMGIIKELEDTFLPRFKQAADAFPAMVGMSAAEAEESTLGRDDSYGNGREHIYPLPRDKWARSYK